MRKVENKNNDDIKTKQWLKLIIYIGRKTNNKENRRQTKSSNILGGANNVI